MRIYLNRSRHDQRHSAFTLLELLAAVTILIIIVTIVGVVFTESDRAWTLGTNRSDNNLAARAALGMISHDLQYAVADSVLTFAARPDRDAVTSFGFSNDEICFVSIQNDSSDNNRAARELFYFVRESPTNSFRYELIRTYYSGALLGPNRTDHCYGNRQWYEGPRYNNFSSHFVLKNLTAFSVYVPNTNGLPVRDYYSNPDIPGYEGNSNRLPRYADICIELLPDREARQAADLWKRAEEPGAPAALLDRAKEFVRDKSTRYATRVYFQNRDGYKERW